MWILWCVIPELSSPPSLSLQGSIDYSTVLVTGCFLGNQQNKTNHALNTHRQKPTTHLLQIPNKQKSPHKYTYPIKLSDHTSPDIFTPSHLVATGQQFHKLLGGIDRHTHTHTNKLKLNFLNYTG